MKITTIKGITVDDRKTRQTLESKEPGPEMLLRADTHLGFLGDTGVLEEAGRVEGPGERRDPRVP